MTSGSSRPCGPALAKATVGDGKTPEEIDLAIRQIVSRAVVTDEVVDLFAAAGLKKPDMSVLSDEFLAEVRGLPHRNLAVELLRKLLQGEIAERSRRNLVMGRSFAELLDRAIRAYQNRALDIGPGDRGADPAGQGDARRPTSGARSSASASRKSRSTTPSRRTTARWRSWATRRSGPSHGSSSRRCARTSPSTGRCAKTSAPSCACMVSRVLRKHGYPPDKQEKATQTVLAQAELLCADWAS